MILVGNSTPRLSSITWLPLSFKQWGHPSPSHPLIVAGSERLDRSVSSHTSHSHIDYFCCGFLQNSSHFPEKPDNFTSCHPVSRDSFLFPPGGHRASLKYSLGDRQSNLLKGIYHFTMSTSHCRNNNKYNKNNNEFIDKTSHKPRVTRENLGLFHYQCKHSHQCMISNVCLLHRIWSISEITELYSRNFPNNCFSS